MSVLTFDEFMKNRDGGQSKPTKAATGGSAKDSPDILSFDDFLTARDAGTLPAQKPSAAPATATTAATTATTTAQPESGGNLFLQWLKNLAEAGNKVDTYAGYMTDDVTIANAKQPAKQPAVGRLADLWQNAIDTNPRTYVSTGSQFMGGGQPIQFEEPARTVKPGRTLDQVRAQNVEETWEPGEERAKRISAKPGQTVEERRAAIFEEGAKPAEQQAEQPVSFQQRMAMQGYEDKQNGATGVDIEAAQREYDELNNQILHGMIRQADLPEAYRRRDELKTIIDGAAPEYGGSGMIFSGSTKQFVSGYLNAIGTALDFLKESSIALGGNADPNAGYATDDLSSEQIGYKPVGESYFADTQQWVDTLQTAADNLGEGAQQDLAKAKAGLGSLGQAGVDIAANVIQMGYDAALGGLPSMFVRSAGSSAQEARYQGADVFGQVAYGAVSGGIEVFTERMFDGVAKIYGAGMADEAIEELIRKLSSSDFGRTALRWFSGAAGEGIEEVVSDLLAPFAELTYNKGALDGGYLAALNPSEILYDFVIGAAIGGLGSGLSIVNGQDAASNYELRMADAGLGNVSSQVNDAWDVLTGETTPEEQQAREAEARRALGLETEEQQEAPRPTREARPEIEEEGRAEAKRDVALDFDNNTTAAEEGVYQSETSDGTGYATVKEEDGTFTAYVEGENGEAVEVGNYQNAGDAAEAAVETIHGEEVQPVTSAEARAATGQAAQQPAQKTTVQVKAENRKAVMESIIEREAGRAGTEISASEKSALADAFNIEDGVKGSTYAAAVVEAYSLGKDGNVSLEEARRGSRNGKRISGEQFQRAFELGRGETASGRTVAVRTKAQSDSLKASLASLGQYAGAAAEAYENGQDVGEYAAGMSEAAERYAVTGTDIRAQGGVPADSVISMLTDAQIEKAQEIGGRLRAQRTAAISQLSEQRKAIRAQARAIEQQNAADADALTEINRQIREANKIGKDTVALFKAQREALTKAADADPDFQNTEEYAKAFDEAKANMEKVQDLQRAVEDLNAKKKALEAKKPTARKKGTVNLDGGNIAGTEYKGVDLGKLTRQQQNIVAMVERLADLINIDYVVFDGPANMGGAYMQGGRIFININAGMTKAGRKSIAAASLSHELTHFMQEYAPEEYQQLKDYVIGTILNKSQAEFDRMIRQQRRWEPGKSYDELADELVANACQTMLTDDKAVQRMARSNMTLAQKVADVLDEIGEKIRKAFEGLSFDEDRAIFAPVKAVLDEIDGITERWADGISAAVENYNAEQTVRQAADTAQDREQRVAGLDTREQTRVQFQKYVDDEETARFLAEQEAEGKVVHTYKSFLEIDGKLYPPMAVKEKGEDGKYRMRNAIEPGRWVESEGNTKNIIIDPKTGKGYFLLKKDEGTDVKAAYNPYQHSSNLMLNDQFTAAYSRPNLVTYECIIPESELTSGYRAEYAKDAVGLHPWKSGPVAGKLAKAKGVERQVYLSRWLKPVRKVPESEVARHYKELLEGTNIAVPSNVVPPALLRALEDIGVKIEYDERSPRQNRSAQFQVWDEVEKEAEKHFGTTDNFRVAGYLMPDGKMLDFSGAHWLDGYDEKYISDWRKKNDIRQVDHEDIYEAFEAINEDEAPSDSSLTFIKRGNIRLVPELPGIELYSKKEPTAAQYRRIKEFIRTAAADPRHYNSETFTVDLTQDRRHRDGALRYDGKINADRVINDLKHFYQTGEVRDSSLSTFYQRFDDTTDDTTSESRGRDVAYARLQSENAILTETVAAMKKFTGKQGKTIAALQKRLQVTTTPEVRQSDARKLARQLIRDNGSKADAERVSEQIKALGDYILQTDTAKLDENEMKSRARAIASEILNSATEQINVEDDTFQRIAGEIKGRKLSIDEDFLGELDQAGGYDAFRKSVFGSFTLAKRESASRETRDGYMTVDQFYTDMQGQYGKGLFPDAANEGEQVQIIAQMLDAAKPMEVNPFEQYMGEATEELANRIVMDAMNGVLRQTAPTTADRQKARTQALKEQIDQLKAENKLEQREAASLYHTVYDLTVALDKAASKYQTLRTEANYRAAQLRAEGTARAAEIKAAERSRAADKIAQLKEHYREIQQNAKERRTESAGVTKYRKQVEKKAKKLYDMLMTNSNDLHVPEVLKAPLGEFLESLDFTSKRSLAGGDSTKADEKFGARLIRIQQMLANQQSYINGDGNIQQDLGGYIDVSPEILDYLRNMAEMITTAMNMGRTFTVNQMTAQDLKTLSEFMSNLRTAINNMNRFMANARYESVQSAARADIEHMKALGKASEISASAAVRFAGWENGTPYYILKRFGAGAKSIFDGFAKGWERLAFNAQEIIDFTEKLYTDKEVRDWKRTTHDITLEDGSKIKMTTAQIMELSMLLGREQAVKHISRGGIRIGDIETKKGKIHDTAHYHLSDTDIKTITGTLTERQSEVAKAMQRFMADRGAEWGNEVSMRRFGYKFYEEGPGYYPIKTDSNDRPMADTDAQTNSMFRLLNLSASKSLNPKASNALVVGDIFDTFADHMSDMAKLNGMGLPILDAIKWFNYKERVNHEDGTYDTVTLQGAMEEAFGEQAQRYFRTLMKDINGVNESGDRGTSLPTKLMSNYKIASVAANLRVAFLQPTSYIRATTVLKPKYMAGIVPSKAAYREAMKYSGTAVWKALGYYETDISRGLREKIAHDDSFRDKFAEASLSLAELGDKATWSMLWQACKKQAKAESPSLSQESLMEKTAELFREVVYSSQVMDSTLTRSEIMRGKTGWTKAMSAFMAEPTLSYNILMDAASEYNLDVRKNGKAGAWKRNSGKIGKAFTVYVASAAFAAVVESIADAVRDDDDEEFWEKFRQALWGEKGPFSGNLVQDLTILGKLPYVKNFISTLQGYTSGDMSVAAFNNLVNVYKIWEETIKLQTGALDKATKVTSYGKMTEWGKVYKTLQALSQLSGFAVSNLTRDVTAIWNTAMNGRRDEWKIRTYNPNALSQSKTEAYEQYVKNAGISKKQYEKILSDANLNGGTVSQDEMGIYLTDALRDKDLTKAQATAVWTSLWNSPSSKTYDKWLEGKTKEAAKPKDDAYADYKKNVSIYDKDGAYEGWKNNLQGLGVSLDTFTKTINAANIDGNSSLRQDELGEYLYNQIQNKRMTEEEANAWFLVFWNGQRSKTYSMWEAKNKK